MPTMKRVLLFAGLLLGTSLTAQPGHKECHVIQTNAQDTTKKHVSLVKKFDEAGRVVYERYSWYNTDYQNGKQNGAYHYEYFGDHLTEKMYVEKSRMDQNWDTTRWVYIYENNRIKKEITYKFEARIKKDFKGCEPKYPDDFSSKQWYLVKDKDFYYNTNGQLIEEYAPTVSIFAQNRYTYEYDPEGRLLYERSYSNDNLIWTEQYRYEPNKTTMTRLWEHEGKEEKWTNPLFWTFVRTYDDRGNLIREECSFDKLEEKNVFHSATSYAYDASGRLLKVVSYGKDYKAQIVHEYVYK